MININKIYRKIIPVQIRRKISPTLAFIFSKKYRREMERKTAYGKLNPDKIFYVIRKEVDNWGLFTTWLYFIDQMEYALKNKYIPVIDLKNYYITMMQETEKKYVENAWEYYFEQPCKGYSLDEVYKSKNVVMSSLNGVSGGTINWNEQLPASKQDLMRWNQLTRKYFRLNNEMLKYIDRFRMLLIPDNKRILGVALRRNFEYGKLMKRVLYNQHPEQENVNTYISDAEKYMKEWNCDFVFLSVEDREVCELFKRKFGEKCIFIERPRFCNFENGIPILDTLKTTREFSREQNILLKTKEYIAEIVLLSECTCLLTGVSGGAQAAYIMNGNHYENIHVYKKGLINVDDVR